MAAHLSHNRSGYSASWTAWKLVNLPPRQAGPDGACLWFLGQTAARAPISPKLAISCIHLSLVPPCTQAWKLVATVPSATSRSLKPGAAHRMLFRGLSTECRICRWRHTLMASSVTWIRALALITRGASAPRSTSGKPQ
eukprot:8554562-Pyramimonas_sp.AAC.1